MSTEKDIHSIRTSDGRGTVKILVTAELAAGKLLRCVRLDGVGGGCEFIINASEVIA